MNLITNHIPRNWNPDNTDSINRWFDKINRSVEKSKGLLIKNYK